MTPEEMKSIFNRAGEPGDPFLTAIQSSRQLEALYHAARAEALEEAARVAEKYHDWEPMLDGSGIAAAIRALKEPKP